MDEILPPSSHAGWYTTGNPSWSPISSKAGVRPSLSVMVFISATPSVVA